MENKRKFLIPIIFNVLLVIGSVLIVTGAILYISAQFIINKSDTFNSLYLIIVGIVTMCLSLFISYMWATNSIKKQK